MKISVSPTKTILKMSIRVDKYDDWVIDISNPDGITCLDVFRAIHTAFRERFSSHYGQSSAAMTGLRRFVDGLRHRGPPDKYHMFDGLVQHGSAGAVYFLRWDPELYYKEEEWLRFRRSERHVLIRQGILSPVKRLITPFRNAEASRGLRDDVPIGSLGSFVDLVPVHSDIPARENSW